MKLMVPDHTQIFCPGCGQRRPPPPSEHISRRIRHMRPSVLCRTSATWSNVPTSFWDQPRVPHNLAVPELPQRMFRPCRGRSVSSMRAISPDQSPQSGHSWKAIDRPEYSHCPCSAEASEQQRTSIISSPSRCGRYRPPASSLRVRFARKNVSIPCVQLLRPRPLRLSNGCIPKHDQLLCRASRLGGEQVVCDQPKLHYRRPVRCPMGHRQRNVFDCSVATELDCG